MRAVVLLGCLALALAEQSPSKRGIGSEAFPRPHSQDSNTPFNLQDLGAVNQVIPSFVQPLPIPTEQLYTGYQSPYQSQYQSPYQSAYQSPYLGQQGGLTFTASGGGYSQIPPQVAPQQKPAQLALAAAAAVAQQNFGNPAYGQPQSQYQDPQAAILGNVNAQLYNQLPQYREYGQQLQNYVRQPIALNYGNTQIRAFPPPQQQPRQQAPLPSTFQSYAQGQGIQGQIPYGQGYYAPPKDLFQRAPPQVQPEAVQPTLYQYGAPQAAVQYAAPQPAGIQYVTPQPAAIQYSTPQPSYDLQSSNGPSGAYSYSSFSSGEKLATSSGFRPIIP